VCINWNVEIGMMWYCIQLSASDDVDNDIDELLQEFESRCQRTILHTAVFN